MYFIGLDISKYKHDCFIVADSGEVIRQPFSFENNSEGFASLLDALSALDSPENVKIGFEATSHYAENLKRFLVNHGFSFMEFNPLLLSKALKANSLRKTKTDKADAISIAHYLMSVVYKPNSISLYHIQSLKSLTRLRHSFVKQRSFFLVQLTNLLDLAFPEFKPFFGKKFSLTALFILEKYKTPKHIANMNLASLQILLDS